MFNPRHWNTQVLAVAAGIAVPALVLGKAAMGISISFQIFAGLVATHHTCDMAAKHLPVPGTGPLINHRGP